jgi:hypothetical protein
MSSLRVLLLSALSGHLLSGGVAAAADPPAVPSIAPAVSRQPDSAAPAPEVKARPADQPAAASPPPDAAIVALRQQLEELKQEVEMQKALVEATTGDAEAATKEAMFRIYGWTDMGFGKIWTKPHDVVSALAPTTAGSFTLGNINVYLDFQPTEKWSSLVELRYTNLPNGTPSISSTTGPGQPNSTLVGDYNAPIPWTITKLGGVIIERAYIQYRHNDAIQLRVGQFLTPFGIWNVDHGAPTLIALALPVFMIQQLFPRTQIGLQVLGSTHAGNWEFGYAGYISNGRTAGEVDPTDDKMFGGRLYGRTNRPWRLQVGVSGLTGRYSDKQTKFTGIVPPTFTTVETTAYREIDLGLDVSLDVGPLRVRSELSRGQYVYEAGKRPADMISGVGARAANSVQLDWYLLTAYRLPWLNLEPYFYGEAYKWPTTFGDGYVDLSVGLNIYFTPVAQLRFQYVENLFFKDFSGLTRDAGQDKKLVFARLVLGF